MAHVRTARPTDEWYNKVMANANDELTRAALTYANIKELAYELTSVDLPEGCTLSEWAHSYSYGRLQINIPKSDDRQWRGLNGTAGIVYAIRKLFRVAKFNRATSHDGSTTFTGSGKLPKSDKFVYVEVVCEKQIPDSCELVPVTSIQEVTTFKTVCK